jgi:signal transduction histidine kinase
MAINCGAMGSQTKIVKIGPLLGLSGAALLVIADTAAGLGGASSVLLIGLFVLVRRGASPAMTGALALSFALLGFVAAGLDGSVSSLADFALPFSVAIVLAILCIGPGRHGSTDRLAERHSTDAEAASAARLSEELGELRERYEHLFQVSHLSFSEQDFSGAALVFEKMRAQGATDFRAYMRAHPDELAACVRSVRTTRVNDALVTLMGFENVAELEAKPPLQNADLAFEILTDQLELCFTGGAKLEGRTILIGKDGRRVPIYYTVNRVSEYGQVTSNLDLSEYERLNDMRMAAQMELARANRAATMGALSASITHELNQPILSMLLDTQNGLRWLSRDPPDLPAARRALDRLGRTAERAAAIVKATRARISHDAQAHGPVDMMILLDETIELVERDLQSRHIFVKLLTDPAMPPVLADRVALQQVVVNFLSNAADAMEDRPLDQRGIVIEASCDSADAISVRVTDSGPGISEENLGKIFDPFFTTKDGGVGLGLQICRSTIENLGGTLKASNSEGGGATFEFTLPAHRPDAVPEAPAGGD